MKEKLNQWWCNCRPVQNTSWSDQLFNQCKFVIQVEWGKDSSYHVFSCPVTVQVTFWSGIALMKINITLLRWFAHLVNFSLNFSISTFVIHDNLIYHRFRWYATLENKHSRKRFQNFRQSYVLLTCRIEIHQSQPGSMTQRKLEGHASGCDWWISFRSVNNT